jgi:diaminopimelate decarboxylase
LGSSALQVEPGRALVANPGLTLYRVLARKRAGGRTLLAVDGGMSDNLRPALTCAQHESPQRAPTSGQLRPSLSRAHCESGTSSPGRDAAVERPRRRGRDGATGAYAIRARLDLQSARPPPPSSAV